MIAKYRIYFYFLCQQGGISPSVVLSGGSRDSPPPPPTGRNPDSYRVKNKSTSPNMKKQSFSFYYIGITSNRISYFIPTHHTIAHVYSTITNLFTVQDNLAFIPDTTLRKEVSRMSLNHMEEVFDIEANEQSERIRNFFLLMAICNTVVVSRATDPNIIPLNAAEDVSRVLYC